MNYSEINSAKRYLDELKGCNLVSAGRASSLAWFLFVKEDDEYALHLQTGFRVVVDDSIYFTSSDIFQPSEIVENAECFNFENFDWDVQGNNRYDEKVKLFSEKYSFNLCVSEVSLNQFGDLLIQLSGAVKIEVFVNASRGECWRFFKRNSDSHLVITGEGLENDYPIY